jgi:SAM-dependent methyltransferase
MSETIETQILEINTGNETAKVYKHVKPFLSGKGIDIGCGPWPLANAETLDINPDFKPDFCCSATKVPAEDGKYDFVFSSHCLEHIWLPQKALKEWLRILKPEGFLVLFLPHKYFYPNVRDKGGNAGHKCDFTPDDIASMLSKIGQTYLVEVGTLADKVTARWENKVGYKGQKEADQYSFYVVACKKKKTSRIESFFIESWLNRIYRLTEAVTCKIFLFRLRRRNAVNK